MMIEIICKKTSIKYQFYLWDISDQLCTCKKKCQFFFVNCNNALQLSACCSKIHVHNNSNYKIEFYLHRPEILFQKHLKIHSLIHKFPPSLKSHIFFPSCASMFHWKLNSPKRKHSLLIQKFSCPN